MFIFLSSKTPRSFNEKLLFQLIGPQHILVHGAIPPQVQDFAFPLVGLHEAPASSFLQPVEVPLDGNTSLQCVSHSSQNCIISKLAEGKAYSVPSFRSLMKTLKRTGSSIDLWGTPLDIGLQLEFIPVITILGSRPFNQF